VFKKVRRDRGDNDALQVVAAMLHGAIVEVDVSLALECHSGTMNTVTLSVKQVPRTVARSLKARAARNHRSLQGELLTILTAAAETRTVSDLAALAAQLGLSGQSESAALIRADRDGRRR
jgi:antitoxin FitA